MYVSSIVKDSPAQEAGLRAGDVIVEFGSLNKTNFENLSDALETVRTKSVIYARVLRVNPQQQEEVVTLRLRLVPTAWTGGAVLGCVLNSWPPDFPVFFRQNLLLDNFLGGKPMPKLKSGQNQNQRTQAAYVPPPSSHKNLKEPTIKNSSLNNRDLQGLARTDHSHEERTRQPLNCLRSASFE